MMFCSNCGAKNNDGAKFCNGCGSMLVSNASAPQVTPVPQVASVPQSVPVAPVSKAPKSNPISAFINKLTSKQKTTLIIAAAAIVLVIVLIIVFASSCGGNGASSPRELAEKYVKAFNSDHDNKRDSRLIACYLPELTDYYYKEWKTNDPKDVLNAVDEYYGSMYGYSIVDYNIDVYYDDYSYLLQDIGISVDQTVRIKLFIQKSSGYEGELNLYACESNGRWYLFEVESRG